MIAAIAVWASPTAATNLAAACSDEMSLSSALRFNVVQAPQPGDGTFWHRDGTWPDSVGSSLSRRAVHTFRRVSTWFVSTQRSVPWSWLRSKKLRCTVGGNFDLLYPTTDSDNDTYARETSWFSDSGRLHGWRSFDLESTHVFDGSDGFFGVSNLSDKLRRCL